MRIQLVFWTLSAIVVVSAFTGVAGAQATRTWVSGVGDDANPCSRTAPCKTFPGAISKTAAGGEISCLDPGGFGQVTITKAMTIDCGGIVGSILASTTGIIVSANALNDVVTIRNLTINGAGTAATGVSVLAGKAVRLENLKITNFTTNGVLVNATNSTSLTMNDVTITDANASGISLATTTGVLRAVLRNIRILNAPTALLAGANAYVSIQGSTLSLNAFGVRLNAGSAQVNISGSELAGNTTAVQSFAGGTVRSVASMLIQNQTAFDLNGGSIYTDGENKMVANTSNGSITAANLSKM
jgi:nitrous oxidase accessory protein NosD